MTMGRENVLSVESLLAGARANPGRVVVVCANNEEAMEAVDLALKDGVVSGGTFLGNRAAIEEVAKKIGIPLDTFEIIETSDDTVAARTAAQMIAQGKGDFLLKGQVDTKVYLKAVLDKEFGLVPAGNTLTHVAVLYLPSYHKFLISSDAAILIEPSVDDKEKMVRNAVQFARDLGIARPKVSMQAAVEKVNPKMSSTVHAEEIVKRAKAGAFGDAMVEGPHDIYIATSKEAAAVKKVTGEVVGDADVVCFHDINSANVFYKSIQRFVPGAWAAGLVAGAKVPILLPSRADEAQTKRMSILVAAFIGARKTK
jgi:phosphate butyryltransferase